MRSRSGGGTLLSRWVATAAAVAVCLPAAEARAQPANQPVDTNGNGTLDTVVVDGDYDGDGHAEPEDIQAAIHALNARLPGEPGTVTVRADDYVEVCRGAGDPVGVCDGDRYLACASGADCAAAGLSGSDANCRSIVCQGWDVRPYAQTGAPRVEKSGLIDLDQDDADLTIHCDPGTTIRGIPNKRRFDGTSPPADAAGLGEMSARVLAIRGTHDVVVEGCGLEGGIPRGTGAYDPVASDWPLVVDSGTAMTLVDAAGGWQDDEWDLWWVLLRPSCEGPGDPHAWCSGAEEFVQILATADATDALTTAGFAQPPAPGDRYAILYHSGGMCTGNPALLCINDADCVPSSGTCDQSMDDDVGRGSRTTVYISTSENVVLRDLRVSGSSHSGVYAKNSRSVELLDSELFENGGYYGQTMAYRPSIYWFSGNPDLPCWDGDTDCRFIGARVEGNEIHHGGKGVNIRSAPKPGQRMGIEDLVVRDNHIHDLFSANGSEFEGVHCGGANAVCEDNVIERTGTGVIVTGDAARGWPSEQPPEFLGPINSWVLDVRGNTIRDLWSERGAGTFGILVRSGNEEVTVEGNTIDDVGRFGALGDGIRLTGPNRHLSLAGNQIGAAESESMMLRNTDAPVGGVGDWEVWVSLEAEGEDLGLDASSHLGDPAGFGMPSAIERLEVQEFGRLALVDDVDSGKRGGVGGEAEALYVSELFFQDATGLLNLNGIHLYIGELTGDPAQIVDLPFLCGNGAVDEGEECDDDNLARGDGCWNTCEVEDGFALFGAPAGGTVDIVLGGVALGIATSPGHSLLEVLEALEGAINSDPTLQAAEISAERVGNAIATNGDISTVDIQDDGLFSSPAAAPALGGVGLVVLAALVIAYALRNLRRTVCR